MIHKDTLPDLEYLRSAFKYCPATGVLSRVGGKKDHRFPEGSQCGSRNTRGHIQVRAPHKLYQVHRIIWKIVTGDDPGEFEVDHINNVRSDNRWCNLRLATRETNMHNSSQIEGTVSGVKGVYWRKDVERWTAQVTANGKRHYLGRFNEKSAAVQAVREYRERLHGEFHNHG